MDSFSRDEMVRYSRQMILPEVGGLGQKRIRAAAAVALTELEALYLAGAGVGAIDVPTEAMASAVRALNPNVIVSVGAFGPAIELAIEQSITQSADASCERALTFLRTALAL